MINTSELLKFFLPNISNIFQKILLGMYPLKRYCSSGFFNVVFGGMAKYCDTKITREGVIAKAAPATCGSKDGFDDTHDILSEGIVEGLKMRSLSHGIGRTYRSKNEQGFSDTPIDHIYVGGPLAGQFLKVRKVGKAVNDRKGRPRIFGSDHHPLLTVLESVD